MPDQTPIRIDDLLIHPSDVGRTRIVHVEMANALIRQAHAEGFTAGQKAATEQMDANAIAACGKSENGVLTLTHHEKLGFGIATAHPVRGPLVLGVPTLDKALLSAATQKESSNAS